MPFIDTSALEVIERLPGWHGRYFHSPSMTFAHYDFNRGSSIHEHFHPQEEVYEVIEGDEALDRSHASEIPAEPADLARAMGLPLPRYALLETTGRKDG